jgi:WD40 repeat protein
MKAKDCFCVAFDPQHDYRLASGGADGFVQILDLRRLDEPVESLGMHAGNVTSLAWSHSLPGLLVSAGEDGTVLLWDANRLQHKQPVAQQRGQQQQQQGQGLNLPQPHHLRQLTASVQQQGHPGLLFIHGGHLGPVGGLALNPSRPWLVASSTGQMVEAADRAGNPVVIHRQPLMVWEVNRDNGLLC